MSNSSPPPDVAIVGAGLAGLAAAAFVARAGHSVAVYERHAEPGGFARSTTRDGFTFNQGPHALYRGGAAERVLTDLGVAIDGGQPPTKGTLVLAGRPELAPGGALSLLQTKALGWREKAAIGSLMARLPRMKATSLAGTSVTEWIADATPTDRAADLAHALVRLATYVHDPTTLSAEVAVRQLQVALGPGVLYLHGGWQSLVDQLRHRPGIDVRSGTAIDTLPDAAAVIVAVGGPSATGALLNRSFETGPAATASCLDFGLSRAPRVNFALGGDVPFYFSNHSAAADLAEPGTFHAAAVQYLGPDDEPDPDAIAAFARLVAVDADAILTSRKLHRMTTVTAIPTADQGGLAGRPGVADTGLDNVFMAGDWVGPTGHLTDAVLASAEVAAQASIAAVERQRRG
ncbi:MAG: NAD(P)-binding protein [Acidimicrobiales bacterium]|nr:NAD(P)-binding protein [Acidimicrobiales bacterium]